MTDPETLDAYDHRPLQGDRLWFAAIYWLFWNRESRMRLLWLLRYHRRPIAWARKTGEINETQDPAADLGGA